MLNKANARANSNADWLGGPNEPLTGFSWKSGTKRDTTGILMWNDVFLHDSANGKYAIVLMDTQGLFDHKTPTEVNARIFSMSLLVSSLQIFNLKERVREDQLEYLQVCIFF
jgi:atlastin